MTDEITVRENTKARTYDALIDDRVVGTIIYEDTDSRRVFTSTVVDPEFRGRGIGSELVRAALDDVRAKGVTLTNHCSFTADYIAAHPAYADLVDSAHPGHPRRHPTPGGGPGRSRGA